ncbi:MULTISPECIES: sigma-70 family RNA polymerase sigma factor [Methylobacterium]|jgi:RNA polymerase sigma-70 factor (ECF subfamily)|uniref:sigma-70 family RNA polymerase sigma factor n=1 Tax=Methylobacterium TaxID=407 RepID=UPI0009E79CFE|nr:sigma-70 family RNA polymerase sigma factor [Methylobacterium sp. Leaf85]
MSHVSQVNIERIYRDHNSWLVGWIRSYTKSISSADDIAAEVFLRLLSMENLASIREPRAMMVTIARRLSIEIFRRNQLQKAYEAELAALPPCVAASPEHQLLVEEALREISRILATMSPKARTAFMLSQIDGMTYTDIAKEIGVSITMVRKYIAQCLLRFYQYHPDRT